MENILGDMEKQTEETIVGSASDLENINVENVAADMVAGEQSLGRDLETFNTAVGVITDVEERAVAGLSDLEHLSAVGCGVMIGQLDMVASKLLSTAGSVADTEAMDENPQEATKHSIEAISDKIKSAWEAVKKFFKVIWVKIQQLVADFLLWIGDSSKKVDALVKMADAKGDLKDKVDVDAVAKKLGVRLASANVLSGMSEFSFAPLVEVEAMMKAVMDFEKGKPGVYEAKDISKLAKSYQGIPALTDDQIIKVSRVDGTSLRFVVAEKVGANWGYSKYVKASLTDKAAKEIGLKKVPTLAEIIDALKNAADIAKQAKAVKDTLYKEMTTVAKEINTDIEKVQFEQGIFKMVWSKTLGEKSLDQLTAEEKVSLLRNKSSLTSTYTFDILYGINGIVKDTIGASKICLDQYVAKK